MLCEKVVRTEWEGQNIRAKLGLNKAPIYAGMSLT